MGRKVTSFAIKHVFFLLAFVAFFQTLTPAAAQANDLPLAAGSPLAGFAFDDRPLLLPVQRNFQMAMLTAGSELGRSCGKMEAYGWRMSAAEQQRVNQIFNNTVDRLRGLGYSIEAQTSNTVSHDITLFTADRPDKHFLVMWSAGEIGLVMTLCQTNAPVGSHAAPVKHASAQTFPPQDVVQSKLETPVRNVPHAAAAQKFTPLGNWVGGYTCTQGYTGGTLQISDMKNNNFIGTFRFYPTQKNPNVPRGRYIVYGQYDPDSQRILINPGKWIDHPKNYYNTVIIGSFDLVAGTFSAYFQGINGCTSFEARYAGDEGVVIHKTAKAKKRAKKSAAKSAASASGLAITPSASPPAAGTSKPATGLAIAPAQPIPPAPAPAPVLTPAAPVLAPAAPAAVPSPPPATVQTPAPADAPASIVLPSPTPQETAPPLAPVKAVPPSTTLPPPSAPVGTSKPGKSGSLEPANHYIVLASGEYFTPQPQQAAPPQMAPLPAPTAQQPSMINPVAPSVAPAVPAQQPQTVAQPNMIPTYPQGVPPPQQVPTPAVVNAVAQPVPPPVMNYYQAPQAQQPQMVPQQPGGPGVQ